MVAPAPDPSASLPPTLLTPPTPPASAATGKGVGGGGGGAGSGHLKRTVTILEAYDPRMPRNARTGSCCGEDSAKETASRQESGWSASSSPRRILT